jgi:hypothetical protein
VIGSEEEERMKIKSLLAYTNPIAWAMGVKRGKKWREYIMYACSVCDAEYHTEERAEQCFLDCTLAPVVEEIKKFECRKCGAVFYDELDVEEHRCRE